ncbi:DUF6531 domain-containing protein [Streptomyces sp. NPDC056061]|uniref:DUF6531 domain-containing protein n=1 Tax=Streptomyces sp. NPDC056061 TaxID=3345700 RepID=UPI0035D613E4
MSAARAWGGSVVVTRLRRFRILICLLWAWSLLLTGIAVAAPGEATAHSAQKPGEAARATMANISPAAGLSNQKAMTIPERRAQIQKLRLKSRTDKSTHSFVKLKSGPVANSLESEKSAADGMAANVAPPAPTNLHFWLNPLDDGTVGLDLIFDAPAMAAVHVSWYKDGVNFVNVCSASTSASPGGKVGFWGAPLSGAPTPMGPEYYAKIAISTTPAPEHRETEDWSCSSGWSTEVTSPVGVIRGISAEQTYGAGCDNNSAASARCQATRSAGINTATGAFSQHEVDASIDGALPLSLERNYSSNNQSSASLGKGWAASWDARLEADPNGDMRFIGEDGSSYSFSKRTDGTFSNPLIGNSRLSKAASGFELRNKSNITLQFNEAGRLLKKVDGQGRATTYAYTSGTLDSVTSDTGRRITFSYSEGKTARVTLPDGRRIEYGYVGSQLNSVSMDGETVRYTYDAGNRLEKIYDQRNNEAVNNTYDAAGRVSSQDTAARGTTKFAYDEGVTHVTRADGGVWSDLYVQNVLTASLDPFGNKVTFEYDENFNQTEMIDQLGRIFRTEYNTAGQVTRQSSPQSSRSWNYENPGDLSSYTNGNGKIKIFLYDSSRRLKSVRSISGNAKTYSYTSTGLLESFTDSRGKITKFSYDTAGNQTSITYPDGSQSTRKFDEAGRVKSETDPRGNTAGIDPAKYTTTYEYDDGGRLLSMTDANGNATRRAYDAAGNLATITDAADKTTAFTYDTANRITETKDPAGRISKVEYDAVGNVASRTDTSGAETTYTYDKANRLVAMTTPRGNVDGANAAAYMWTYGYDKVGNQTAVTDPTGKTTKTEYDAENRPIKVTDPLGHFTKTSYDGEGNVLTTTDELGKVTTNTYDDDDRLSSVADRGSKPFSYGYDADGNLTSETSPLGFKTTYGYDDNGRLTDRVEPRGNVTGADPAEYTWHTSYDAAGNVTSQKDPLGNEATTTYDAVNNVTASTDRRGKKTQYEYDALDRLKKVTAPDGGTTLVDYDEAGRMSKRTNANQHATIYEYDSSGRLTKITDPLQRATSYEYDADGNRTKVTNARGQTITTTYDARNLPGTTTYSDGTPQVTYTYYDDTRPKTVTDGTGTRTVTYDLAGRPLTITQPGLTTPFTYTYNPNGTIASRTYPDSYTTAYKYDDDGRPSTQTTSGKTTTYSWDEAGNLTSTKLPSTTPLFENRTYDRAGQLASLSEKTGTRQFTRDPDGRVLTDTYKDASTTGLPSRYVYDDAGRMTRACTDTATTNPCTASTDGDTYHYDKAGNLTSSSTGTTTRTNTHDAADQLTKAVEGTTTTDFTYDADGNLTKDATGTYAYDAVGRAKSATIGADTLTFVYDADGNRTLVNKNGTLDRTTRWDINNPLAQIATETSGTDGLIADYEYNATGTVQAQNRTAGSFYMLHDRQDSVRAVHDSTGTEVYAYTYDPWGVSTGTASTTNGQTSVFGYTGQYKDPYLSGRLNLRDRTYDPANQRFTTTDPEPPTTGTPNSSPYAYANNDPANQADPSGRCPLCVSAGIGAVIGAAVEGGIYSWQHRNDGQFSWTGFGKAAGEGAATGAVAGLLMPGAGNAVARGLGMSGWRGIAASATVNAGVGAGFSWAINETHCRPTDPWDLLWGAAGGATSSLIGPAFNWARGKFSPQQVGNLRFGPGGGGVTLGYGGIPYKTPITPRLKSLVNPQGSETNCRACAVAVDHLLRDGTVSVAPGSLKAGSVAPIEQLYGRTFQASTVSGIVKEMKEAGHGARGIVYGGRGRNAHVFNVVNIKGDVIFLDGQQGQAKLNWRNYSLLRTN